MHPKIHLENKWIFILIILIVTATSYMSAQDGFGQYASGGAGGASITVTNSTDLTTYAASSSPYIITISGTINLTGNLNVQSNKTIQGADAEATINGDLKIGSGARSIIIRCLNITNPSGVGDGDGITIINGAKNVFVNHCTFTDCADGSCDITRQADSITISWCRFRYVNRATHRYVNLIGANDADTSDLGKLHITFHHCWYDQLCNERMPSVRFGRVHAYNNYYSSDSALYCIRTRLYAECLVENNYFENVKNPWELALSKASGTITGKLHADNNNVAFMETTNGITWLDGWYEDTYIISKLIPGTDTVFIPPYPYTLDIAGDVKSIVMAAAGNTITGIAEAQSRITGFSLKQNYPNPFNPSTIINYELPKTGNVKLKVYDMSGKEIATLVDSIESAGKHQTVFNGGNYSSGVYFVRLSAGKYSQTIKIIMTK